jgi:hypothetical protein
VLIQSHGFETPKACAAAIQRVQTEGHAALADLGLSLTEGCTDEALDAAMAVLREAKQATPQAPQVKKTPAA